MACANRQHLYKLMHRLRPELPYEPKPAGFARQMQRVFDTACTQLEERQPDWEEWDEQYCD